MAATHPPKEASQPSADPSEQKFNPMLAAALFGGTVAAAAGAYWGTRALASKNREKDGRPPNSVMAAAMTACDVAHPKQRTEPRTETEPRVPAEPAV